MKWQDYVIALCQLGFIVALIPTIRGKEKPAIKTSVPNVAIVSVVVFCLITLRLWFSAITGIGIAICWLIITIQTMRQNKLSHND